MILIKNAHIKTITSADIGNGCILIGDNGKIAAVEKAITPPDGAEIIDAQGKLVTPGCIEAHCHVGIGEPLLRWAGEDYNEIGDPITPHMRAIDGINPQSPDFKSAIQGGITTMCITPGSTNVIGGSALAVKAFGKRIDDMVIKNPIAIKCAFGENPKNWFGQMAKKSPFTRIGIAALLREALYKAKGYAEDKAAGKDVKFDIKLEALLPVINREIPLKVHAHRADDLFTAIRIAKEFNLRLTLDHCTEGHLIADELAKEGYPLLVGPSFGWREKSELEHKDFITPGVLHKAGCEISIITDADVTPIENLPLFAGMAVNAGLPLEAAWRAITINPAKALGIDSRVGSLEAGKDADIVIWTADPLNTIGGNSYMTIINGEVIKPAS